jgi:hypothetical protein
MYQFSEILEMSVLLKVLATGTKLIHQAKFCDRSVLKPDLLNLKDGIPLNL